MPDWAVAGVGEQVEGTQETFGADGYVHFLDHGDDPWVLTCAKFINLYSLNMCSLLHVSYNSVKLFFKMHDFPLKF